jgi:hypothetical protein
VPPLNAVEVARVDDCPRSKAVGLTEIAGNEGAAFTMTVAALDVIGRGELELSVTWSSNDHVPTVGRVPVDAEADDVHGAELPKLL